MEKIHKTSYHVYIKLGLMVIGYGLLLWFCGPGYAIKGYELRSNLSLPVSIAGFAVLLIGIFQKNMVRLISFGAAAAGLLYISLPWAFMINFYSFTNLHFHDTYLVIAPDSIPIIIYASIWTNDTMAYLVGSIIGKTPLTPISPKKTWEGTIGGVILCIAVVSLLLPFLIGSRTEAFIILLAIISGTAAITGTFGDLFESRLKRMAGVKDSGNILPGHGGFLDRFDSMLFAIPATWLLLTLMTR
jgi:phosphatidate cytidylyltransferase